MEYLFVAIDVCVAVVYTQVFKFALQTAKDHGAMTVLMQIIGAASLFLFVPLFGWQFPTDPLPIILMIIAAVFYGISDRINTTVRSGVEASTYSMIKQLSTVFMVLAGFLFFKEPLIATKIIGAVLIIASNIIIFWKPHQKINKYFLFGLLSTLLLSFALFFDVGISNQFNLPFYIATSFFISSLVLVIFGRISPKRIVKECKVNTRSRYMIIVGVCGGVMMLAKLLAYQFGEASTVAPLVSLTVLANVIVGYVILKERSNLPRKIFAAMLIVLGVILISAF